MEDVTDQIELTDERVLETETVKTVSFKALLEVFSDTVELRTNSNPLPVTTESGEQGFGTVYVDNNKLIADLVLNYSSPERLLIETGEKVYPSPEVVITYDPGRKYPIYEVFSIKLTSTPLYNSPGLPVGKPIL